MEKYVIGLDYGSDSARAIVVNALTGETLATAVKYYPRWKEGKYCNPAINQYRQHPLLNNCVLYCRLPPPCPAPL